MEHQRDSGVEFEIVGLGPKSVLAQMPSVVAEEQDHGALGKPQSFQFAQHPARLGVHETGRRVVPVNQLPRLAAGQRSSCGNVLIAPEFLGIGEREIRSVHGPVGVLGQGEPVRVVQLEVSLGCGERQVRFLEAYCQEEGLIPQFLQRGHGPVGDLSILQRVGWYVRRLPGIELRPFQRRDLIALPASAGLLCAQGREPGFVDILHAGLPAAFRPGGNTPGRRVGLVAVQNFPDRLRVVAGLLEPLRQRHESWERVAEVGSIPPDPRRVRPQAG